MARSKVMYIISKISILLPKVGIQIISKIQICYGSKTKFEKNAF
jgi:hypothetical protein